MSKEYYRFNEMNDHEGETWHFYIEATPENKLKLDHIKNLINDSDYYSIDNTTYSENIVDVLVKYANDDCDYMDAHQKVEIKKVPKVYNPDEDDDDPFYKGQIFKRIK